jgi:heptosyltransferase-3
MSNQMQPEELACLIAARNLGDIVVQSDFLRKLAARNYARRYLVWTRPQLGFLFSDIPNCEVICSQFPVGTTKQFGFATALLFIEAAMKIRKRRPSVTLDLVGDFRERWFARMVGSRRHIHIGWEHTHTHSKLIRNPFGIGRPVIKVPAKSASVYAAYQTMLNLLAPDPSHASAKQILPTPLISPRWPPRVGLHPFASQPCKLWPAANWRLLTRQLLSRGATLTAFAAPSERDAVKSLFAEFEDSVAIFTGTIPEFANALTRLDLLIGLDSFSVHMAHRQGVSSITINAGTPTETWAVPSGRTLGGAGGCVHYPCYNIPKCRGTSYEYACVKSVSTVQVLDAVDAAIGTALGSCAGNKCQ